MIGEGERIGAYTILRSRGSGGMGVVWEARASNGEIVAVKLMHDAYKDDHDLIERFRREYTVGKTVSHANLVSMREEGTHEGTPYLVMDLAPGKSLRKLIDKGAPYFREWEAAYVGQQVASAIAELHRKGVTHRDMKSSNVMVDRDLHVTIVDYGIAKLDGKQTQSIGAGFMGSAEYGEPQAFFGKPVTRESDIYALGIVLYEMLAGRVPFRSDRYIDTLEMQAKRPVPEIRRLLPMVSEQFDRLIFQMLQKDPARRPAPAQVEAGCKSVLSLLGRAPGSPPASSTRQRPAPPPSPEDAPTPLAGSPRAPGAYPSERPAGRSPWPMVAAGGGVLAVILAIMAAVAAAQ